MDRPSGMFSSNADAVTDSETFDPKTSFKPFRRVLLGKLLENRHYRRKVTLAQNVRQTINSNSKYQQFMIEPEPYQINLEFSEESGFLCCHFLSPLI
jgi:hypothetical protein